MVTNLFTFCFHALLLLGSFLLSLLPAADVSGSWAGVIDARTTGGESNRVAIYLVLKQSGTEVTGTFGPSRREQYRIEKGVITGDTLTFRVAAPTRVATVTLTLQEAGRMAGDVATADGNARGRMSLAREDGGGRARRGHRGRRI